MIEFSNELERLLAANKITQAEMARICGVSEAAVSRWLNRAYLPSTEDIEKAVNVFPKSQRALLVKAWLLDLCPSAYRQLVDEPHLAVRENEHRYQTEFERAIEILRQHGDQDPDAKPIILSLARMLRPKSQA